MTKTTAAAATGGSKPPANTPKTTVITDADTNPLKTTARQRRSTKHKAAVEDGENTPTPSIAKKRSVARPALNDGASAINVDEMAKKLEEVQAALEQVQAEKVGLEKQLKNGEDAGSGASAGRGKVKTIPKPKGSGWSIQVEMGLSGTPEKDEFYNSIVRELHELTFNARINWELEWRNVPARDKATLFEVARDEIKHLRRYENDWATDAIVRQFCKNKRNYAYKKGWLEPPTKYGYLQANAAKRTDAPRKKRAAITSEDAGRPAKKAKVGRGRPAKGKGKGKARALTPIDEEGEGGEEMGENEEDELDSNED